MLDFTNFKKLQIIKDDDMDVLTVRDIMAILQIDRETVYRWRKSGKINMIKVGGKWYAKTDSLKKMLE